MAQIQTQNVSPEQGEVQVQTKKAEKKFLVRVVKGHDYHLHIWNTEEKKQLLVRMANEYLLFSRLIDYLMQNGHKRYFYSYYQRKQTIYTNPAWEMLLTSGEIMSLLVINKRNEKCGTLLQIKQFLSQ